MAKEYDYKAVIVRTLEERRKSRLDTWLAKVHEEQSRIIEHNRCCTKDKLKPLINIDHARGLYERHLDRVKKISGYIAEKTAKALLRDAAEHGETFDPERLAEQAVETSHYAEMFYFSCVLQKNQLAVS